MLADETAKEKPSAPAAPELKSALGERRGDTDPAAVRVCISLAYDNKADSKTHRASGSKSPTRRPQPHDL